MILIGRQKVNVLLVKASLTYLFSHKFEEKTHILPTYYIKYIFHQTLYYFFIPYTYLIFINFLFRLRENSEYFIKSKLI